VTYVWEKSYPRGVSWDSLLPPAVPLYSLLESAAAKWPDRTVIDFYDHKITFRELHELAARAAKGLQTLGVGLGVHVGLHLPNTPHFVIGYADRAVKHARNTGQAAFLMYALEHAWLVNLLCGNYEATNARADELFSLADEKSSLFWKAGGTIARGGAFALKGSAAEAVETITSGLAAWRATGSTMWLPLYMSHLASAYAGLGQFREAWHCIGEAIDTIATTKERWFEAEVNRAAGEIALKLPEEDAVKAEASSVRLW